MEGLGDKFQKARTARNLTLEEAARITKIRPGRLAELEAEDFSNFPSLAYAKGFLVIYGKFLDVDVSPYLEAFETSESVTVDGYSYLQDNPAPKPRRTEVVRQPSGGRGSLLPLVIGIVVLVAGFSLMKLIMDIQRITPKNEGGAAGAQTTPAAPAARPDVVIAPRALPAGNTPLPSIAAATAPPSPAPPVPTTPPAMAIAAPSASEPEVRRAEPVHPEDLVNAASTAAPEMAPAGTNQFEIRPLEKTYVKVVIDNDEEHSIERWMTASDGPVQFRGQKIAIRLLDRSAVEIRKNGKPVARGDADISVE